MKHYSEGMKMYVIRKYVIAKSVAEALRVEPKVMPHEIFIDEKWQDKNLADAIGFNLSTPDQSDE